MLNTDINIWQVLCILLQEERRLPDLLYVGILSIISLTAFITHLPSLCYIVRHFRRPNNANLIYRNLLLVDLIFLIIFVPMDIFWSLARSQGTHFRRGPQPPAHSHFTMIMIMIMIIMLVRGDRDSPPLQFVGKCL